MKISPLIRICTAVAFLAMVPALSSAAEAVGRVLFAIGDARLAADGSRLKKDDPISVGQAVVTGANGHVHIRFVDDAFVSVRPNSKLEVEQYVFDERDPKHNRVRFALGQGVARLITGKAGQAAKDNFRLNTPVAAIGIRGTDFLVQAKDALTRVAVQQGAVVIAPFSNDCLRDALGPCGGGLSAQLAGTLTGRYLEVTPDNKPVLQTLAPGQSKDMFGFPRPEEPKVNTPSGRSVSADAGSTMTWGRWTDQASAPAGYELLGKNDALVLYRTEGSVTLPQNGTWAFTPIEVAGYSRGNDGVLKEAEIKAPTLSVNFNTNTYKTTFTWVGDDRSLKLHNSGSVTADGRFVGSHNTSNVSISGGFDRTGDEAAYVFMRRLAGDDAYGLIRFHK